MECNTLNHIWVNLDLQTAYWTIQMAEKPLPLHPSLPDDTSSNEEV